MLTMSESRQSSGNRLPRAVVCSTAALLLLSACQGGAANAEKPTIPSLPTVVEPTCDMTPDSEPRMPLIVEDIMPEQTRILLEGTDQEAQTVWDEVLGEVRQQMNDRGFEAADSTVSVGVVSDDRAPFYATEAADAAARLTDEVSWRMDMEQRQGTGHIGEQDYLAAVVVITEPERDGADCRLL